MVTLPTTAGASCATPPPVLAGGSVLQVAPATVPATTSASVLQVPPTAATMAGGLTAPVAAATAGAGSLAAPPASGAIDPLFGTAIPSFTTTAAGGIAPTATVAATSPAPQAATAVPAAAPAAAPAATPTRLTAVGAGGTQQDADLVEATLGVLRSSPAGAQLVDRLLAVGANVNVVGDEEFRALGHGDAHAFYDPKVDTIYMRRSDLGGNRAFAAVALAHEGTHLLDDVAQLSTGFIQQASTSIAALGGNATPAGRAAMAQASFELTMIKEARAFTYAGQVARELGVDIPSGDPTSIAASGGNDAATYAKVWNALLATGYNPDRRAAAPRSF